MIVSTCFFTSQRSAAATSCAASVETSVAQASARPEVPGRPQPGRWQFERDHPHNQIECEPVEAALMRARC
jgi:hypothetical protein